MYKFITFIRLFVKFATVFLKYILKEIAGKFIYCKERHKLKLIIRNNKQ